MLNALNIWVKQIITVVIFATFVDFLISGNRLCGYIRVFLGILVTMAIINPLTMLLNYDLPLETISFQYDDFIDATTLGHMSETFNKNSSELAFANYTEEIQHYIGNEIAKITPYEVKKVNAKIEGWDYIENPGKIEKLEIILKQRQIDKKTTENKVLIETIKLTQSEETNPTHKEKPDFADIIEFLRLEFNIEEDSICIDLED